MDFVNDDVFLINNGFEQYVLRSPEFGGMFSIWFTDPVAFAKKIEKLGNILCDRKLVANITWSGLDSYTMSVYEDKVWTKKEEGYPVAMTDYHTFEECIDIVLYQLKYSKYLMPLLSFNK